MDPPNPSKRPLEDTDNVAESPKRIKEEIENQSEVTLGSNDSSSASDSSSESEDESSSGSETSGTVSLECNS